MLNPTGFDSEKVIARGSCLATAIHSHVDGTSLKEGSEHKGVAASNGSGLDTIASDNTSGVMDAFSVGTLKQWAIVVSSSEAAATGSSFGDTGLVGSSAKNGNVGNAPKSTWLTGGTSRVTSLCGRNTPPNGGSAGPDPRHPSPNGL